MSIPETMRHVSIREAGGPEVLFLDAGPVPEAGAGEVLIRVAAAGINRPDVMQRQGRYSPPPGASPVPGLEVAGAVAALGAGVRGHAVGDRVCALVAGGGYAEYCSAPAPQVLPVPAGLSMAEAAGVPETFFTVWTNVFERGRLQEGESILVHGGSSGIGTTTIQLARLFGAGVIATAGSAEKCRACLALGAGHAVNYRERDFVRAVADITGGRGVDVVLDMVGGDYVQRNIACLALEGRLVQISFLQSPDCALDLAPLTARRLTITGSTLRPRTVEQKGAIARQLREKVWPLFAAGRLQVPVHARFPLERADEAHRLMESSAHIGKIILEVA